MNNQLGIKLKELRKAHSYTQDYLAEILGVVRQTYSNYETGKRKPDSDVLYKLAGLYGISIDDLLHLTTEIDRNIYYDAPAPSDSSIELQKYLDYFNDPVNQRRYQNLSCKEKDLLYYFDQISELDKEDFIEFIKIKAKRKTSRDI